MAIVLQNAKHRKNVARTKAVSDKTYVDIVNMKHAKGYLATNIQKILMNQLKTDEGLLIKNFQETLASAVAEEVLFAKDMHDALSIMKQNYFYYGRGDYTNILKLLSIKYSEKY